MLWLWAFCSSLALTVNGGAQVLLVGGNNRYVNTTPGKMCSVAAREVH